MKLLVEIPNYRYRTIKKIDVTKKPYTINERSAITAIKNGTPLPKGHGVDVINKIRAEIENIDLLAEYTKGDIKRMALAVIDKYKVESEIRDGK